MADWVEEIEQEHDVAVVTEAKRQVKEPPRYKVLLHNDDYTTMEFVVYILQVIFHQPEAEAVQTMLKVHYEGVALVGVYTFEVAEAKAGKVMQLARAHEYPLLCTLEEE